MDSLLDELVDNSTSERYAVIQYALDGPVELENIPINSEETKYMNLSFPAEPAGNWDVDGFVFPQVEIDDELVTKPPTAPEWMRFLKDRPPPIFSTDFSVTPDSTLLPSSPELSISEDEEMDLSFSMPPPERVIKRRPNARRPKNHPNEDVVLLREWYDNHRLDPFPSESEKIQLSSLTRTMSPQQVSTWFVNIRKRARMNGNATLEESPHSLD